MKKLITLIAGLLLVALPVGLAGCDDRSTTMAGWSPM